MANGWFVVMDPKTGLVAAATVMTAPEDNRVAINTFAKALKKFTRVNCLVYDRMCKLMQAAAKMDEFKNIKSWSIDKFHAQKHKAGCKCNPLRVRKLTVRLAKMNTNVCEQTFAWFRRYNTTVNHMQPLRRRFMVLNYLARHNKCVLDGNTSYLSPMIRTSKKRKATPYMLSVKQSVVGVQACGARSLRSRSGEIPALAGLNLVGFSRLGIEHDGSCWGYVHLLFVHTKKVPTKKQMHPKRFVKGS